MDRIDARTDEYALGVILYEVLSGHRAYAEPDALAVLRQVREEPPPPLVPAQAATSSADRPQAVSPRDRSDLMRRRDAPPQHHGHSDR